MISAFGIGIGTLIIFLMMISLLFIGMPLGFLTGLIALVISYLWFDTTAIMQMIASRVTDFTSSYTFVAVPMFVLMATLLDKTGIARDLTTQCESLAVDYEVELQFNRCLLQFYLLRCQVLSVEKLFY